MKYFITADTHGYFTLLNQALLNKGFDISNPKHVLVICGDLFDRGPEARYILDFTKKLDSLDRFIYIRGNHEDLLNKLYEDIIKGRYIESYHYSNGTVATLCQLIGEESELAKKLNNNIFLNSQDIREFQSIIDPIIKWINERSVNYFEFNDYIFVHGWIPEKPTEGYDYYYSGLEGKGGIYTPDWRQSNLWDEARWLNGMNQWKKGVVEPNKTIVCGHFHCSWGWSHIRQSRKEFPTKNLTDWQKSFEPFIDKGIIALDACTAYSGLVNIEVIGEE